ncbi:hypothetical protein FG379_000107 [Cryptosporidium bovis]|uniref:uncharacterized protein n=1 Tax=Cryptosporidium bovis TaxID=310047 RepID=UPI00351A5C9A|nr:hypothetical protein FG379_000107 [Cryptosporidium bovis]
MSKVNSRISKVPVIMFSPSIMNYKRFTLGRLDFDPDRFQCLMIVQSLNDKIVPTRDIMELISIYDEKKIKTHFVKGVGNLLPTYASVSIEQLKRYMSEILEIASKGDNYDIEVGGTSNSNSDYEYNNANNNNINNKNSENNSRELLVSNKLATMHSFESPMLGIDLPLLRKTIPVTRKTNKSRQPLKRKSLSEELEESGYNQKNNENESVPLLETKLLMKKSESFDNLKLNEVNKELIKHLESIQDEDSEYKSDSSPEQN